MDAEDRDTWVHMAFAPCEMLSEKMAALSGSAGAQRRRSTTSVRGFDQTWARVKPGPITAASLFGLAKQAGYRRNRDDALPPRRARPDSAKAEREAQHRQQRADDAATRAQAMLKQAEWAEHPYLLRKALGTRRVSGYRSRRPQGIRAGRCVAHPNAEPSHWRSACCPGNPAGRQPKVPAFRVFGVRVHPHHRPAWPRVCWWVEGVRHRARGA